MIRKVMIAAIVAGCFGWSGAEAASGKVIAIVMADTNNADLGKSAATNVANFEALLNDHIRDSGGIAVEEHLFRGADFRCEALTKFLAGGADPQGRKLSVKPADTVIFYYSGHGYRVEPAMAGDKFPMLQCSGPRIAPGSDLRQSSIVDKLLTLKPRLVIDVADACNVLVFAEGGIGVKGLERPSPQVVQRLFLGYKGVLSFSGSVPGTAAAPQAEAYYFGPKNPQGGVFSNQLLAAIRDELIRATDKQSMPTWQAIEAGATKLITPTEALRIPKPQQPQFDDYRSDPKRRLELAVP